MTVPACETVLTPSYALDPAVWDAVRAASERENLPPIGLALFSLHRLATSPKTKENPNG